MPFAATKMDLEIVILSEVSQTEKQKHVTSLICGIQKDMMQMNLFTKQKQTHRLREQIYGCWGKYRRSIAREFEMDGYTLLRLSASLNICLKWMVGRDLLCSTGNSAQCYVADWMGGEFGKEWMHVYVWLSPFAVYLKLSQHC